MLVADSPLLAAVSSKHMSAEIGIGNCFPSLKKLVLPDPMCRSLQIEWITSGHARGI